MYFLTGPDIQKHTTGIVNQGFSQSGVAEELKDNNKKIVGYKRYYPSSNGWKKYIVSKKKTLSKDDHVLVYYKGTTTELYHNDM